MTAAEASAVKTAQRIRARWNNAGHTKGNLDALNYRGDGSSALQWTASRASADQSLRYNQWQLRDKSRVLELGNPYAERFFHELESNILSADGMTLQMQIVDDKAVTRADGTVIPPGGPDTFANTAVEDAWYAYWHSHGNCDVTGEMSGLDAEKLELRSTARDGDAPVRILRGFDNEWKFALQFIEGDQLDPNFNETNPRNGNEIRMSVELDKWGRRVAYHIMPYHAGDWQASRIGNSAQFGDRLRIPAEGFQSANDDRDLGTMFMPFPKKRIGQTRGWPWLTPVMDVLNSLFKYEEAELVATRAAAEKMGFFTTAPDSEGYTGPTDERGNITVQSAPGIIETLPAGVSFQGWDPRHPNGNYGDYRKGVLRQIASGLGVSYNVLANDLEGVNYSSLRGGLLDEREIYKMIQRWFIDSFMHVVFEAWLGVALLTKKINLPVEKFDKFNKPFFQGRRWAWVDPLKDMNAAILAVENGFKSRRQIIAENGGYVEDVYNEIEADEQLARNRGDGNPPLIFGTVPMGRTPAQPPDLAQEAETQQQIDAAAAKALLTREPPSVHHTINLTTNHEAPVANITTPEIKIAAPVTVNVPKQDTPIVNVDAPIVNVKAPVIKMTPNITMPMPPEVVVNVSPTPVNITNEVKVPMAQKMEVQRDANGKIKGAHIEREPI